MHQFMEWMFSDATESVFVTGIVIIENGYKWIFNDLKCFIFFVS